VFHTSCDSLDLQGDAVYFYAHITVTTVPKAFCFKAVCAYVIIYYKFINMISYKPLVGISPDLQPQLSWAKIDELISFRGQKVKGQGHSKTTYYGHIKHSEDIFHLSLEYIYIF